MAALSVQNTGACFLGTGATIVQAGALNFLPGHPSPGDRQASQELSLLSRPQLGHRGGSHQGDEVGECEGQRDLYTLPLVCRPELLVVAFLFK